MTDILDLATNATVEESPSPKRKIEWFTAKEAVGLGDSGLMSPAAMNPEIFEQVDLSPLSGGARTRVLFQDSGPTGLSLVHVWFGENFPLPRHTHNVDCLYYVIKGELHMGSKVIYAGDGLFIPADRPYTYRAGPGGVELLEFRSSTEFTMTTLDQDVAKWQSFAALAQTMQAAWSETRPAD